MDEYKRSEANALLEREETLLGSGYFIREFALRHRRSEVEDFANLEGVSEVLSIDGTQSSPRKRRG